MEEEYPPSVLLEKLDRSLDRALFGLAPKGSGGGDHTPTPSPAPIEGWRPTRLPDGSWGSLYAGCNPKALPPTSSDSPSLSGPEAVNLGTPPLPRSLRGHGKVPTSILWQLWT